MPHAPEICSSDRLLTLGKKLGREYLQDRGEGVCDHSGCLCPGLSAGKPSYLLALVTVPAVSLGGLGGGC